MSNPFRDIGAGILNMPGDAVLGVPGLIWGAFSMPYHLSKEDSFLEALGQALDNPFTKANEALNEKVNTFMGADPESLASKATFIASMALPGTYSKLGKLAKTGELTRGAILGTAGKQFMKAAAENAVYDKGIDMLAGAESTPATNIMAAGAGLYYGKKLAGKGLTKLGIKNPTKVDDYVNNLTGKEKQLRERQDQINTFIQDKKAQKIIDEKGNELHSLQKMGMFEGSMKGAEQWASIPVEQATSQHPIYGNLINIFKFGFNKEQLAALNDNTNRIGILQSELGNRFRKAFITNPLWTEKTINGKKVKIKDNSAFFAVLKDLEDKMENAAKKGLIGALNYMKQQKALFLTDYGFGDLAHSSFSDIVSNLLEHSTIEDLMRRSPKLAREMNIVHDIEGTAEQLTKQLREVEEKFKLKGWQQKFRPLFNSLTEERYKAGLITAEERTFENLMNSSNMYFPSNAKFNKMEEGILHKSKNAASKKVTELGIETAGYEYMTPAQAVMRLSKKSIEEAYVNRRNANMTPVILKNSKKLKKQWAKFINKIPESKEIIKGLTNFEFFSKHTSKFAMEKLATGDFIDIGYYVNGEKHWILAPKKYFGAIFNDTVKIKRDGFLGRLIKACNKIFMYAVTGPLVLPFLVKRAAYGFDESILALRKSMDKYGVKIGILETLNMQAAETWKAVQQNFCSNMADITREGNSTFQKVFNGLLGGRTTEQWQAASKAADYTINPMFKNVNAVGDIIKNSNGSITLLDSMTNPSKFQRALLQAHNWVDNTTIMRMFDTLTCAVGDGIARTLTKMINDKVADSKTRQAIIADIRKYVSTSNKPGAGEGFLGKASNWIQDYIPYGKAIVQGAAAKAALLDPKKRWRDAKQYIADARALYGNDSGKVAIDVMRKFGQQLAKMPDDIVFNTLWTTVALPATVCYVWNHMNAENDYAYETMQPYERANKMVLTNMLGEGNNLAIPMDQELSVLKNVYEGMLDDIFHLTGMQDHNTQGMLAYSLGQELGLQLPIPLEMIANAVGYQTNISPEALLSDRAKFIEHIKEGRYNNLNPELAEMLMTLTGRFGSLLVKFGEDRQMNFDGILPLVQSNAVRQAYDYGRVYENNLRQMFKQNPQEPILKQWDNKRRELVNAKTFYLRNGCTKYGEILGNRSLAERYYDKQLDELDQQTYEQLT